jgi:hypothetical protein
MQIKQLKKQDKIWECEYGLNIPLTVITDPIEKDEGFEVQCENYITKETVFLYAKEKYEHYGPRIYEYPEYVGHHYLDLNRYSGIDIDDLIKNGWKI